MTIEFSYHLLADIFPLTGLLLFRWEWPSFKPPLTFPPIH
jgi:hypothetical protein